MIDPAGARGRLGNGFSSPAAGCEPASAGHPAVSAVASLSLRVVVFTASGSLPGIASIRFT